MARIDGLNREMREFAGLNGACVSVDDLIDATGLSQADCSRWRDGRIVLDVDQLEAVRVRGLELVRAREDSRAVDNNGWLNIRDKAPIWSERLDRVGTACLCWDGAHRRVLYFWNGAFYAGGQDRVVGAPIPGVTHWRRIGAKPNGRNDWGWFDVGKYLPQHPTRKRCLVWNGTCVRVATFCGKICGTDNGITHWKILPEPPYDLAWDKPINQGGG